MSRWLPVVTSILSAAVLGCGGRSPTTPPRPTSLPPEYRTLATRIAHPLRPAATDFRDDKTLAEIAADARSAALDLRAVRSADPDIPAVAAVAATAYSEAVGRLERINALPKPPGAGAILARSFLHGLAGDVAAGFELGAEAERKQGAIRDELTPLAAALDQADAAHLMLPRIAERYAAPRSAAGGRMAVEFLEAWNGWGTHDWLYLQNAGEDLEDCTVVVELRGAGGRTRTNVHFVERWAGRAVLCGRYDPGTTVDGRPVGRTTVREVASLTVTVLSPKFSTQVEYSYAGAERAKHVAARIALARPHVVCRVRDSAWGAASGKVVVVENRLPHPVYRVGVRVTAANGAAVGEFVRDQLAAGGSLDVGSWQVSRNLVAGDRVRVRLDDAELLEYTVR